MKYFSISITVTKLYNVSGNVSSSLKLSHRVAALLSKANVRRREVHIFHLSKYEDDLTSSPVKSSFTFNSLMRRLSYICLRKVVCDVAS